MSGNAWKISDKMCVKPQPKRRIYLEPIYEKENLPIHELQKSKNYSCWYEKIWLVHQSNQGK